MSEVERPQHAMLQVAEMIEGCWKGRYLKLTHKYQYLVLLLIQVTVVNTAVKNYTFTETKRILKRLVYYIHLM